MNTELQTTDNQEISETERVKKQTNEEWLKEYDKEINRQRNKHEHRNKSRR